MLKSHHQYTMKLPKKPKDAADYLEVVDFSIRENHSDEMMLLSFRVILRDIAEAHNIIPPSEK